MSIAIGIEKDRCRAPFRWISTDTSAHRPPPRLARAPRQVRPPRGSECSSSRISSTRVVRALRRPPSIVAVFAIAFAPAMGEAFTLTARLMSGMSKS